jgi:hypothetical protein
MNNKIKKTQMPKRDSAVVHEKTAAHQINQPDFIGGATRPNKMIIISSALTGGPH